MGAFDTDPTVLMIKRRMVGLGLKDFDRFLGQITNAWSQTPPGFGFTCKDRTSYLALMDVLVQNQNFGSDSVLGLITSQHHGASFREVNTTDSLHIILSMRPDPTSKLATPPTCSVHLDSISPVLGKDANGQLTYDMSKVLQHVGTDLAHTPLIPHATDRGLFFTFRFWPRYVFQVAWLGVQQMRFLHKHAPVPLRRTLDWLAGGQPASPGHSQYEI